MPPDLQPGSTPRNIATVEELLRAWEARGLRWAVIGRLSLITAGGLMLPFTESSVGNTLFTAALLLVGFSLALYSLMVLREQQRLTFVGYAGMGIDLVTIFSLPVSWYSSVGGEAVPRVFVVKNDIVLLCLICIMINTLAMRPLYPLVLTAGSVLLHLLLLGYTLSDPGLAISYDIPAAVLGTVFHPGLFAWRIVSLLLIGGGLSWLARSAHQTIQSVVELEHANRQIRQRQAELVMQSKMEAAASLVAGIAHEINTPLGVVMSSLGTTDRCIVKITDADESEAHPETGGTRHKAMGLLKENIQVMREAAQRITSLVSKLKDFVGLDQAEVQDADIEAGIDNALGLIQPELKQRVNVVKEFSHPPLVRCRPKEINQVMMTLLRNGFEAIDGEGTLKIRTACFETRVTMEIADTGRGISAEQLQRLFDIRFAAKDGRVGVGFGLPMARSIIERHGGSIAVDSVVGRGTAFQVSLPLYHG